MKTRCLCQRYRALLPMFSVHIFVISQSSRPRAERALTYLRYYNSYAAARFARPAPEPLLFPSPASWRILVARYLPLMCTVLTDTEVHRMRRNNRGSYDQSIVSSFAEPSLRLDHDIHRKVVASLEDRRRFVFSMFPAATGLDRRSSRIVARASNSGQGLRFWQLGFAVPRNVSLCAKRASRREVMFANGHGGQRGRKKSHRRNRFSDIGC